VGHRKVYRGESGIERSGALSIRRLKMWLHHAVDSELLVDLRVFHVHVLTDLIPVDQILQGPGEVFIGGDHRDELPDIEAALYDLIAADRIEQEWRHLREEVVEKLDQELPLIEIVANPEDAPKPGRDFGSLIVRGIVSVNGGDAFGDLADAAG